jgi:restriction system protein
MMVPGYWRVTSGTQVNFALLFPELEDPKEVSSILFLGGSRIQIFQVAEMKLDAKQLLGARIEAGEGQVIQKDLALQAVHGQIDRLEAMIYSRLNDVLIPKEAISLENSIRRTSFEVEQKLRVLPESRRKLFEGRLADVLTHYATGLDKIRQQEKQSKDINQRIEKLYDLSAREFEEYIEGLFKELGYEKVTLTPTSNDKGIDLLMRHKDSVVAIQCKKYRGTVGSPDIQTFLGAMRHAGAHKGFFITTGTFTFEAEKMASEHPIELVDSPALAKLIEQAVKKLSMGKESL